MKKLFPMLAVRDMERSLAFYTDVLGFAVEFTLPNEFGGLDHASVRRGEISIMFGPLRDGTADGGDRLGAGVILYASVDEGEDIDAYFERVKAAGAAIAQEPTDQFWGDRDWGVTDPDGYVLYVSKTVRTVSMEEMRQQHLAPALAD